MWVSLGSSCLGLCFLYLGIYFLLHLDLGSFQSQFHKYISIPLSLLLGTPIMLWSFKLSSFLLVCLIFCCFDWVISIILSFRSLMSSKSPSLPFVPSSVLFLSVILFFSSDHSVLIFSSSLLNSHCVHLLLFPSLVSILITNVLNSLFGILLCFISFFHSFFFFSCYFIWNKFLCLLILFKFLWLYVIRWNSYLSSLKGVSLCGSVPVQSECAPRRWWESWIWGGGITF